MPLRLPVFPAKIIDLLDDENPANTVRCYPADRPKNTSLFCTIKLVLFQNESGIPWRIFPDSYEFVDCCDIDNQLTEMQVLNLYLPPPKADVHTARILRNFGERVSGPSEYHIELYARDDSP